MRPFYGTSTSDDVFRQHGPSSSSRHDLVCLSLSNGTFRPTGVVTFETVDDDSDDRPTCGRQALTDLYEERTSNGDWPHDRLRPSAPPAAAVGVVYPMHGGVGQDCPHRGGGAILHCYQHGRLPAIGRNLDDASPLGEGKLPKSTCDGHDENFSVAEAAAVGCRHCRSAEINNGIASSSSRYFASFSPPPTTTELLLLQSRCSCGAAVVSPPPAYEDSQRQTINLQQQKRLQTTGCSAQRDQTIR